MLAYLIVALGMYKFYFTRRLAPAYRQPLVHNGYRDWLLADSEI